MKNATVVMLLDNPFLSDSRVEKEADSLIYSGFEVIVYCVSDDQLPAEENRNGIVIKRILNLFFQKPFGKNYSTQLTLFSNQISKESFDILHCHDFMLMPLAAAIKKQKPRIFFTYDSHEYLAGWPYYKEIPNLINRSKGYLVWMRMLQNEKKATKAINALLAPSAAIAKALQARIKLGFSGISVRNIPESKMIDSTISLKETLKISKDRKLIVHSGSIYMPPKFIEQLISFVNTSENLSLVFIGNRPIHSDLKQRYKTIHHIYFVDYQPNILLDQLHHFFPASTICQCYSFHSSPIIFSTAFGTASSASLLKPSMNLFVLLTSTPYIMISGIFIPSFSPVFRTVKRSISCTEHFIVCLSFSL